MQIALTNFQEKVLSQEPVETKGIQFLFITSVTWTHYKVGTRAKKAAARNPAKNVKAIVPVEVKQEPFEYLLLQGGAVDITNPNTEDKPKELSD